MECLLMKTFCFSDLPKKLFMNWAILLDYSIAILQPALCDQARMWKILIRRKWGFAGNARES
jgi:hypothetical protein